MIKISLLSDVYMRKIIVIIKCQKSKWGSRWRGGRRLAFSMQYDTIHIYNAEWRRARLGDVKVTACEEK